MNYNFLNNLVLVDTGRVRAPKQQNPEGLTVRIFANGDVYPSKELVETFDLEYKSKTHEVSGNGFDIIDSTEWTPMAEQPRMILFGLTSKTESKVDLFGSCRYNEDQTPKSSVLTQGSSSESLLNLVRSMGYLTEDQKYCDLQVLVDYPIKTQDGIAYIPKTIERGEKKGNKTYERRENVVFYPVNTVENIKEMNELNKEQEEVVSNETILTSN